MTIITRMARAIYEANMRGLSIPRLGIREATWDELGPAQERYIDQARAALAAAREPDEAMWSAGDAVVDNNAIGGWQAMIDAALGSE